jgi:DHA1 family multidrug resistance protein-like MFS transporter
MSAVHAAPDNSWRRTFAAMVSVQFIIAAAFSIVPPVIPLMLPQIGVTEPHQVSLWAGLVLGVTPLTAGLMAPVWGRLVDTMDRRNIILGACMAAAVCTLLMSLSTSAWQLLTLRFLMGFFGGHIVAVMALTTGICPPSRIGAALGWLSTAQLAGMLFGPLIGGSIADAFQSYRAPFVAGGCASLLVAIVVLRLPRQVPVPRATREDRAGMFAVLSQYPELVKLVAVLLLVQLAITSVQPIISLHVRELVGPVDNLATLAGIAFSVIGISGLIAAPIVGRAGDRVGRKRLLAGVLCGAAVFTLIQSLATTYPSFVIERFAAGLFLAGVMPLANSLVAHGVKEEHRGRAFGMTGSATFLGAFAGPLSGGVISAYLGVPRVFESAAAALIFAAIVVHSTRTRAAS